MEEGKGAHDKEVRMCKSEAVKGNEGRERWRTTRRGRREEGGVVRAG